jgi:DNA polymerase
MDDRRAAVLQVLGIERFVSRTAVSAVAAVAPSEVAVMDHRLLAETIHHCEQCDLATRRTRSVVGSGAELAPWFLLAEAPDPEDNRSGEVLTGRMGALLSAMLRALGLSREQVFVSTAVKCATSVQSVSARELTACAPYTRRQMELQQPKVVLCFGAQVADQVLGAGNQLVELRGRVHRLPSVGCAVVVTHALADILKTPAHKAQVWTDLQLAADVVHGRVS